MNVKCLPAFHGLSGIHSPAEENVVEKECEQRDKRKEGWKREGEEKEACDS